MANKAAGRNMKDQTIGPVLSWTTDAMLGHVDKLKSIPGASLAFGGKKLEGHTIPERYGAIEPTAVFVPLKEILKPENFELVTTEVFGPLQVRLLKLSVRTIGLVVPILPPRSHDDVGD